MTVRYGRVSDLTWRSLAVHDDQTWGSNTVGKDRVVLPSAYSEDDDLVGVVRDAVLALRLIFALSCGK